MTSQPTAPDTPALTLTDLEALAVILANEGKFHHPAAPCPVDAAAPAHESALWYSCSWCDTLARAAERAGFVHRPSTSQVQWSEAGVAALRSARADADAPAPVVKRRVSIPAAYTVTTDVVAWVAEYEVQTGSADDYARAVAAAEAADLFVGPPVVLTPDPEDGARPVMMVDPADLAEERATVARMCEWLREQHDEAVAVARGLEAAEVQHRRARVARDRADFFGRLRLRLDGTRSDLADVLTLAIGFHGGRVECNGALADTVSAAHRVFGR